MASKDSTDSAVSKMGASPIFSMGQQQIDAALAAQKALMDSYEQANRTWLARVQAEIALWSDLATKLTTTRSAPEAIETCSKCFSERMQMTVDDGRQFAKDSQQITQKVAQALSNGSPAPTA